MRVLHGALGLVLFAFAVRAAVPIDSATMQRVYDEVKTPFKYGVVLRGETNQMVDCPSIFRRDGKWFMMYVAITGKTGYETFLAESEDLLNWRKLGKILPFKQSGWDGWQADGGAALVNPQWGGDASIESFKGKCWLSYVGGATQGYETDPLSTGIAWTKDPTKPSEWTRIKENPVLTPCDSDVREFERLTLYKSTIIHDRSKSLGTPFVIFYNAKYKNGFERIGMATSKDMVNWKRFGTNCVVANGEEKRNGMSGDPQLVKMGDVWVMFYFGAGWKPKAFDTFAVSRDLVNWTKWEGENLVEPSAPWDATYAHKPWVLKHDAVVYHFYCAVGNEGRVLALATSKDLKPKPGPQLLVIVGDSTVANYAPEKPARGWGMYIQERFKSGVIVSNLAANGRSTKTFREEGRWKTALALKPDYVLIQFGHNDSHAKERHEATDAATDFTGFLRNYVDESRDAGAVPILVTPMMRRNYTPDGKLEDNLQPYADAMKAVAAEKGVAVIDLHAASRALYEALGPEKVAALASETTDKTHFNEAGARAIAKLVLQELPRVAPALAGEMRAETER